MYEPFEIFQIVLAIAVAVLVFVNRGTLKRVPRFEIIILAFSLFVISVVCSVIEGFVWNELFNYCQHVTAMLSTVLVTVWCWTVFVAKGDRS